MMQRAFIGRTRELSELAALAERRAPLVTLWGPGGTGKTRLALEHTDAERRAGRTVLFVHLAAARTREELLVVLAATLGIELDARDDASLAVVRAASARHALVIADNVEQLDAEARGVVLALVDGGARVLATSREPFGDPREVVLAVGALEEEDALALFDAGASAPCNRGIARRIVERLDGLPLAIELAAARASLLGGADLLARLDRKLDVVGTSSHERPARHATLRAAIAWSWDLLEDVERDALLACATFEAPFDAALAEEVIAGRDALDRLERLRDRALVHVGAADGAGRPSLRLLEAVRDFAREMLAASESTSRLAERHATAVLARTEPVAEAVRRGADTLDALLRRRDDLAAIARQAHLSAAIRARAAIALGTLLAVVGPATEVISHVSAVMADLDTSADAPLRARLLVLRAEAYRAMGDLERASRDLDFGPIEDRRARADASRVAGIVARSSGETEAALRRLEEALEDYRAVDEEALAGICLDEIGAVHQTSGKLALARERHTAAIAVQVATESRRAEGVARSHLAVATHRAGEPAAAVGLHEHALAIHRESRHRRLEGAERLHLGFVHHELAAPGPAREHFREARALLAAAGARSLEAVALLLAARMEVDEGNGAEARTALAEAARLGVLSPRLAATRDVVSGHLASTEGQWERAAEAYRTAIDASSEVVVGFEALTPAYLALALARRGDAASEVHLARAHALLGGFENPHLVIALAILEAAVRGVRLPEVPGAALAASSEVRRALAFAGVRRALSIREGGRSLVLPDGRTVDLSRRKNLVGVLLVLARERRARPGVVVSPDALVEGGWPGEKMLADARTKRLHTAIWTLRSLGLEGILLTDASGVGYLLDPSVPTDTD